VVTSQQPSYTGSNSSMDAYLNFLGWQKMDYDEIWKRDVIPYLLPHKKWLKHPTVYGTMKVTQIMMFLSTLVVYFHECAGAVPQKEPNPCTKNHFPFQGLKFPLPDFQCEGTWR
jgi:hypothetical protein